MTGDAQSTYTEQANNQGTTSLLFFFLIASWLARLIGIINAGFLLRTSQCDSEFEGGETTSHAEEFQVMCVDTMLQTGSTSPTSGRPCVVSPPGDGRRTGGKARLSQEKPDQRFLSRLTPASSNVCKPQGQAGVTETALFCCEPLPGTHRDHSKNAGQVQQRRVRQQTWPVLLGTTQVVKDQEGLEAVTSKRSLRRYDSHR